MPRSVIVVLAALAANLGIATAKFVAAVLTGSSAMLSEGIHSLVDTGNQAVLMVGIRRSHQPPDELHQFGHGKELYFWSMVVAVLLFGVGGGLAFYEGVDHFFHPHPIENVLVSYVVLAISFVLEAGSWTVAYREISAESRGRRLWHAVLHSKDPSVVAVLLEDSAALVGLVVAFLAVAAAEVTGEARFDGLGSIVIGAVLTAVAIFLAAESRGLLVGERAQTDVVEAARAVIERDAAVREIESLRTMHLGPRHVLLTARVRFKPEAGDLAQAIARIKHGLAEADPLLRDTTIEPVASDGD